MVQKKGISGNIGKAAIYAIVILLGLICLLPMMNILAISFSSSEAAAANAVGFLPVKFTTAAYEKIIGDGQFWRSFGISVLRVALALVLNMVPDRADGLSLIQIGAGVPGPEYLYGDPDFCHAVQRRHDPSVPGDP